MALSDLWDWLSKPAPCFRVVERQRLEAGWLTVTETEPPDGMPVLACRKRTRRHHMSEGIHAVVRRRGEQWILCGAPGWGWGGAKPSFLLYPPTHYQELADVPYPNPPQPTET